MSKEFPSYTETVEAHRKLMSWRPEDERKPADVIGNARKRGAIDFVAGVKVGDNPYSEHDARHWAWMQGWATTGLEKA